MSASPLIVLFDGDCGFCQRSVAWALGRDRNQLLRAVPSRSEEGLALLAAHGMPVEGTPRQMRCWSPGEGLLSGSDAVAALCRRLPGWEWAGFCLTLPLIRPLARVGYAWVAANRHRWAGTPAACELPRREPDRR